MTLNEKLVKSYSRIGQRATFGKAALSIAENNDNLFVLTADVSTSAGLDRYRKLYPEKFLDVGIAEQNMIGIAAGMASEGYDVVTATFAPFQTMRCLEQIRVNLGYMEQKVTLVGLASGVVLGLLGYTHCCFEDIGVLRSIPNIAIVSPCDCGEVAKALDAALKYPSSVYLRLMGGANMPIVNTDDYDFEIGKAIFLKEGSDVAIISNGTMLHHSLEARELLESDGISTSVINMHTVKPLDTAAIDKVLGLKAIITVEEHSIIGGLGSAVAEYLSPMRNRPPHLSLGISDAFGKIGEYSVLLEQNGLTVSRIASSVKEFLN